MARYPGFPTHRLKAADFERLLNSSNVTYRAVHRRAELCPCFDASRGSPGYHCPVCDGIGYTWNTPVTRTYTDTLVRGDRVHPERASKALIDPDTVVVAILDMDDGDVIVPGVTLDSDGVPVWLPEEDMPRGTAYQITYQAPEQGRLHAQGITRQRDVTDRGEVTLASLDVTIPRFFEDLTTPNPLWLSGEHDRILFPDLKYRHQQRMERGRRERLTYARRHAITDVRAIVNDALVRYVVGTDLTITANGDVTWLASGPPPGTTYVVDYLAAPEYYVWQEIPQQRHIDGQDLPRRVSLRLFEQYPHRV